MKSIDIEKENPVLKNKIQEHYQNGHSGTSLIWKYLIKTRKEKYFIHIDSDIVFIDNVLDEIINELIVKGNSLVGTRRQYRNRPYRKNGFDGFLLNFRPDVVNTFCFGFNASLIRKIPGIFLKRMIEGKRTSILPVVDYFDPVSFYLIKKSNGKVRYFDSPSLEEGSKDETYLSSARYIENKMLIFHAVGSGINFYKNSKTKTSDGYRKYALASYRNYARLLLSEIPDISQEVPELPLDLTLTDKIARLNRRTWKVAE